VAPLVGGSYRRGLTRLRLCRQFDADRLHHRDRRLQCRIAVSLVNGELLAREAGLGRDRARARDDASA
jgi:hypothetical protein